MPRSSAGHREPLPVPTNLGELLDRLAAEERARQDELAQLEGRLRRFEDLERPAYSHWLRLELGPVLGTIESRYEELRSRRAIAQRVVALIDLEGWQPREALYLVLNPVASPARARPDRMDPDEVEARRRARRDRKRAERRAAERAAREASTPATPRLTGDAPAGPGLRARVVSLYRRLARRLHPDSPAVVRTLDTDRLRAVWAEVQTAYDASDLERLLSIAAWIETAEDVPDGATLVPLSLAERYERLRALTRSCRTLERKLAVMANDPAWNFAQRAAAERRRLRQEAARTLEEELTGVESALAGLEEFFDSIGAPKAPRGGRRR